jgi:serine/threonine-protein kinase
VLDAELQQIELDDRIGEPVRVRAEAAVARARALGHGPSLSNALAILASAQLRDQDAAVALATLEELVAVAARARDDRSAAHGWIRILRVHAIERGKPEIATAMIPVATAAVARAGDQPAQKVNLLTTVAGFLASQGQDQRALDLLDEAAALLPALADVDPTLEAAVAGVVAYTRVGPLIHMNRSEEAIATVEAARAIWERELGPDHPYLAAAYGALAGAHKRLGHVDQALDLLGKMVAVEQRRGAGPPLVFALTSLGSNLVEADRDAEALEVLERAAALARETLPPDAPQRIAPLGHLGTALNELGRRDQALAIQDEAMAIATASGARTHDVAALHHNRAQTLLAMERWADAAAGYRAALAIFEEVRGADSPATIETRIGLGEALLGAGDRAGAIATLERAIAIPAEAMGQEEQARARGILERARAR